jgi:type VI secretion system protein ImpL
MKDAIAHADRYFSGERWVLGDYASANIDRAKLEQDIKARYYGDFLKEWRAYMKSGAVVRYAGLKDASVKLTVLSGNQSPLLELFALASTHTAVDDPAVANVFQPVQTVVPPGSTDRYIAPPNQNYMNALIALQTAIDSIANQAGQPSDSAAAPALTAAQQATTATRQMAQAFRIDNEGHVEGVSQNLLEEPILYIMGMLRALGPAELNAKGKDLCGQMRPLTAKYPFSPNSQVQATLQDINTIFKPKDGVLWAFYDANLQKVLQRQGSQFVPVAGTGMTINSAFIAMMNRAAAFTDSAYANGATDPHFAYTVKPVMGADEDTIKMTIDGQTVEFTQANQAPKQFTWPATAHGVQTSVKFKGTTPYAYPTYDGLWAVFQFVQDADKHVGSLVEMTLKAGKQGRTVNNEATGQPVTLRFEITANPPVFDKNYFAGMGCVAEVAR